LTHFREIYSKSSNINTLVTALKWPSAKYLISETWEQEGGGCHQTSALASDFPERILQIGGTAESGEIHKVTRCKSNAPSL